MRLARECQIEASHEVAGAPPNLLDQICAQCLAPDLSQRFQSAEEILAQIDRSPRRWQWVAMAAIVCSASIGGWAAIGGWGGGSPVLASSVLASSGSASAVSNSVGGDTGNVASLGEGAVSDSVRPDSRLSRSPLAAATDAALNGDLDAAAERYQ